MVIKVIMEVTFDALNGGAVNICIGVDERHMAAARDPAYDLADNKVSCLIIKVGHAAFCFAPLPFVTGIKSAGLFGAQVLVSVDDDRHIGYGRFFHITIAFKKGWCTVGKAIIHLETVMVIHKVGQSSPR